MKYIRGLTLILMLHFLITRGYILGGLPESAASYLDYCKENARWRDERYQIPDQPQREKALHQLINSSKWEQPLTPGNIEFFTGQIK